MGVIIIAVFWLLGLLMAWSMCVVAARADRRMEEIRHTHTDTDISRPIVTVVFHSNDGGADETVKRVWASNNLDMKAIGLPDGWTKKGFAFHGWNLAADGSGVEYKTGESLYGRMTTATVDLYADWTGLQSTLPQAGGILHAAPVAGLSIMMLGVPLLILARRHRHGHANPPV